MNKNRLIPLAFALQIALIFSISCTSVPKDARKELPLKTETIISKTNSLLKEEYVNKTGWEKFRKELNSGMLIMQGKKPKLDDVKDLKINSDGYQLPIRIYTPKKGTKLPILLFYHGGSFNTGNIDTHDNICRYLATLTPCIVISVDYRLAPESHYPDALNDSYNALLWAYANAESFNGDATKIAVAGDSAGGGLAAMTALKTSDLNGPKLCYQLLIYPVIIDYTVMTDSKKTFYLGYGLNTPFIIFSGKSFITDNALLESDPYLQSYKREKLSNLPPAFIITAEYDPLRDDGEMYADKLRKNGITAESIRFPSMIHGFFSMERAYSETIMAYKMSAQKLQQAFSK